MGHSQLDPTPGQWKHHCQQMWPEAIFIQRVFKNFYVLVTSCFSFLLCCSLKYLKKKKENQGNKYLFLVTLRHFLNRRKKTFF